MNCKNCVYFINQEKHEKYDFIIGGCDITPIDIRGMASDSMTIISYHDGYVIVGEEFGCIHFKQK